MIHRDLLATLMILIYGPNTRALINRKIPPEILLQIFNHVRLVPCKRGTPRTNVWDPIIVHLDRLIRLSHVCRDWRNLIINTPTLWNRIDDPRRYWKRVEIATQRACGIPLHLSAKHQISRIMGELWNGDKPIRELRYEGASPELVKHHFQMPAPLLESLSLTGPSPRSSERRGLPAWRENHHVEIFHAHTPKLRLLALDMLSWVPKLQTTALTHLYLADCYGAHLLRRIMSLLSASPNLTDLVLVDGKDIFLDELRSMRNTHPTPQFMCNLRRLVFKCMSSSGVKLFLKHAVQLTSETSVRLSEVRPLQRDLLDEVSSLPPVSTFSKLLITGIGTRFRVIAEGLSAGMVIEHFVAENEDWGTALPRLLPVDQLRELHIVLRDSPALFASTPTAVFDFLASAPALERLYLDTYALAAVLDGLECYGKGSAPKKLACPNVVLHVTVPCHYPASPNIHLIQLFAVRQTKLGIRHLVVEYCPGCRGQPWQPLFARDVQVNFASVTSVPKQACTDEQEWCMLRTNWPACENLTYFGICLGGGEGTYRQAVCRVAQ